MTTEEKQKINVWILGSIWKQLGNPRKQLGSIEEVSGNI
jgi:hypothetical protein